MTTFTLQTLADTIRARSAGDAGLSYTKSLLDKGPTGTAKKFGEEAVELVIAVVGAERRPILGEAADVLFHFLVVLESVGVSLDDVLGELQQRTARSGHEEKASRGR